MRRTFSAFFLCRLEIGDIAFFFQNARNFQLQLGSRNIKFLVTCMDRMRMRASKSATGSVKLIFVYLLLSSPRLLRLCRRTCRDDTAKNRLLALGTLAIG